MAHTPQTKRTKANRYNLRRPSEEEKADLDTETHDTHEKASQSSAAATRDEDPASEAAIDESPSAAPAPRTRATASQPARSPGTRPQRANPGKDRSRRLEGLLAEVSYQLSDEYPGKKRKKVWGLICPSLDEDLDEAHDLWNLLNPQWRATHGGGAPPTKAAFREAILRLGLKHLNDDPEFADLIPRDQRRTQGRDAELEVDE